MGLIETEFLFLDYNVVPPYGFREERRTTVWRGGIGRGETRSEDIACGMPDEGGTVVLDRTQVSERETIRLRPRDVELVARTQTGM